MGDKTALVFKDIELSWNELLEETKNAAAGIAEKVNSKNQEIVGILLTNSDDFIISYLGILEAGHIALPLDPNFKQLEFDVILHQIPPKFVITNEDYAARFDHRDVDAVLVNEIRIDSPHDHKPIRLSAEKQIATIVFTSGTTGKPKAATYSHANHAWNIEVCSKVWKWTSEDTLLISLPLSHWYGLVMGLAGVLYHGNTLYLQEWFDADETLKYLSSGKISQFTHVAQFYSKLLEIPGDYDLSKIRLCISGGAPMAPDVWQQFKDRWGQEVLEVYGSSETGRIASNLLDERIPGSPGRPLPSVDVKLSSDGEVLVKSGGLFPGYYKNPVATKRGFTKEGYWRTGDIGEFENGRLLLKGRKIERIRKKGYTISPRDVEWAMRQNPKVEDIHVMSRQMPGSQDDQLVYFMVTKLNEQDIADYCKQNLLFAWRPDKIVMLKSLPRTNNGKVALAKLKGMIN